MRRQAVWAGVFLVLVLVPAFNLEGYYYRTLSMIFLWIGLASAWNLASGFTGYIDFGSVGYFGIGNYATALLMTKAGWPFFPGLALSGLISGGIALVIGKYTMRLRGAYFGIATLAFAEAASQIVLEFDRTFHVTLFEGSHGITLPIVHEETFFYYVFLIAAFAVVLTVFLIDRSKFGYGLKALREAEDAAELAGVNTTRCKISVYALAAVIIGVMGGINAYWLTYISPGDVFDVTHTIHMIVMALFGGMGTVFGPVIGAASLSLANEIIGAKLTYTYFLMLGVILLIVVIAAPRGIIGLLPGRRRRK